MRGAGRARKHIAAVAAFTLSLTASAFVPAAWAQTMGEYGLATSHAAGAAANAPKAAPPRLPTAENRGSTQTYEIPDDSAAQADDEAGDRGGAASDKDSNDDKADSNWNQVK